MDNLNQQPLPSQPTNQSNMPSIPPSSHLSKTFIILIVIALLLLVGVVSYALETRKNQTISQYKPITISPTISQSSPIPAPFIYTLLKPSNTEGTWNNYLISNYVLGRYNFEVPKELYVSAIGTYVPSIGDNVIFITDTANIKDYYFYRIKKPAGHDLFIITWTQDHRGPITNDFQNGEMVEQFIVNGVSATKGTKKNYDEFGQIRVAFRPRGGNNYLYFSYIFGDKKIFERIISTFKFTDQN